jgi:hypothetical protein
MLLPGLRALSAAVLAATLILPALPARAQSDSKGSDQHPAAPSDGIKETQKKVDELAEAATVLKGPAGEPECVWLGQRIVSLFWRDDLDTAFRHLDLYDRFGCPGGHVQASFRCVVQQGNIDPKVPETLNGRVHACWINPANPAPTPSTAAAATGTTSR